MLMLTIDNMRVFHLVNRIRLGNWLLLTSSQFGKLVFHKLIRLYEILATLAKNANHYHAKFCHGPPSIARRARRQSGARAACERESGTEVDSPGDRCRPAGRRLSINSRAP